MCLSNLGNMLSRKRKGFTMVEIIITILVISLLFILLIAALNMQTQKANETGVEVDMRSFYVAAKGTILSDIEGKLDTKEEFIEQLNGFLDPALHIQSNGVYSNQEDPWNQSYEFRWRSREVEGKTEVWVAFVSKGVGLRDGWIFEPDSPNEAMYSRDIVDAETYPVIKQYRYITVLGYYPGGVIIPKMPDPANDVPWILGEEVVVVDDQWAYLTFDIEDDEIEFDDSELTDEQEAVMITSAQRTSLGDSGTSSSYPVSSGGGSTGGDTGGTSVTVNSGTAVKGSYAFIENIGHDPNFGGYVAVPDYTFSYAPSSTLSFASWISGSVTNAEIDSVFASQGWKRTETIEVDDETDEEYIVQEVAVGNGNVIRLKYKSSDKQATNTWFKVGSTVEITAIPGEDYIFDHWKVDGVKYSEDATIKIVVEADTNFTAKFKMSLQISGGKLVTASGKSISDYIDEEEARKNEIINEAASNIWEYTVDSNTNLATLTAYNGPTGSDVDLIIPSTIDGYTVSNIGELGIENVAFNTVKVPDNVTFRNSGYASSSGSDVATHYAFRSVTFNNLIIGDNVKLGSYFIGSGSVENLSIGQNVVFNPTTYYISGTQLGYFECLICSVENLLTATDSIDENGTLSSAPQKSITTESNVESLDSISWLFGEAEEATIKGNVSSIADSMFKNNTVLSSVTINSSELTVGNYAFSSCTSLTDFNVSGNIVSAGTSAFYNCAALYLDSSAISGCTTIGNYAFKQMGGFTGDTLVIADGATIGEEAFSLIVSPLTNIEIGDDCTISKKAFYDTDITGSVTLGNNCTISGLYAFAASTAGTTSTIPQFTFGESNDLYQASVSNRIIETMTVKAGSTINAKALQDCTITNLIIEEDVITTSTSSGGGILSTTGSVETLEINSNPGDYSFTKGNISKVIIGDNVDTISKRAFNNSTLETVVIGESVREIANYAFNGCTLTAVTINNVEGCLTDSTLETYITVGSYNTALTDFEGIVYLK